MRIVIVLPTYNEAENLPKLVSALFSLPLDLSVLVVDDNSPDGTGRVADDLAKQYLGNVHILHRAGKQGLRSAYMEGFQRDKDGHLLTNAFWFVVDKTKRYPKCYAVLSPTHGDWESWCRSNGISAWMETPERFTELARPYDGAGPPL